LNHFLFGYFCSNIFIKAKERAAEHIASIDVEDLSSPVEYQTSGPSSPEAWTDEPVTTGQTQLTTNKMVDDYAKCTCPLKNLGVLQGICISCKIFMARLDSLDDGSDDWVRFVFVYFGFF